MLYFPRGLPGGPLQGPQRLDDPQTLTAHAVPPAQAFLVGDPQAPTPKAVPVPQALTVPATPDPCIAFWIAFEGQAICNYSQIFVNVTLIDQMLTTCCQMFIKTDLSPDNFCFYKCRK